MNLQEMRDKLTSLTARTVTTDTARDELLNGAYQYGIPSEVTGEFVEGTWTLSTIASQQNYTYPDSVVSVFRKNPILEITSSKKLGYSTYPDLFWHTWEKTSTTEGQPQDCLFYGRVLSLRPIPDAVYTISIFARVRPGSTPLASSGISNRNHAMAVVAAAAREHAVVTGNEEIKAQATELYAEHLDKLRTESLGRSRGRRHVRTF